MKIIIGADIVPTDGNIDLFATGNIQALLGEELYSLFREADYRILNLETPLSDRNTPILKCGVNLIAPTKCIAGFQAMQVNLLTLANNHILDQGQQGLQSTCALLDQAGIAYTGVGLTPKEAAEPYIFECDGKRIGVYACAEHEFSIVTEHSAGANPIDLLESPDHIAALKAKCDYVIVLYHGGKEYYRYPSPNIQKVCRKLVEKGADLVVCQHNHCIGCEEKYQGGTIVYGQGNFLFDKSKNELCHTSLLLQIGDHFEISYFSLKKDGCTIRLTNEAENEMIMEGFRQRSHEIEDGGVLREKYEQFAASYPEFYLLSVSGIGKKLLFKIINKLSGYRFAKWFVNRWYRRENLLTIQNYLDCEAHRELFLNCLQQYRKKHKSNKTM